MPSDERNQTSPQADRLSRKIDRLLNGQPAPVLDGDTEELAELARELMERLDPATPDPEFRAQLKRDLIDPGPRLVPFRRRPGPRRYPVPALFGALTVVLVASAVTGWMVFAEYRDVGNDGGSFARFAAASPTAMSTTGALMTSISSPQATPVAANDEIAAAAPDGAPEDSVPYEPMPTPTPVDAPAGAADRPAAEVRSAVVDLPPVDARHVELGALATVAAPSGVHTDLRYATATDPAAVGLETHAPAYEFSAPYIEADLMLRGVSNFLGVEPRVEPRERAGRTIYELTDPDGDVNFSWSPNSGAFVCRLPDPYSVTEIEDLSQAAIDWLKAFGYPVDESSARPVIRTMDDGRRFIDVPLGDMPNPAIGHPMSITLVVDTEGRIVSASGYWLEVTRQTDVALVSAQQAWDTVRTGGGYWPSGTAPGGPGEFAAHTFAVSYMLTSDGASNHELALQPVIAITGLFHPDDPATAPFETTVYVKGQLAQS